MNVLRGADEMTNRTTPQRRGAIFKLLLIGIFRLFKEYTAEDNHADKKGVIPK